MLHALVCAARDARYLDLVDPKLIIDRKNDEPVLYLSNGGQGLVGVVGREITDAGPSLLVPSLGLCPPTATQRFAIEIWIEKSTMNDILVPLAQRYEFNLVTCTGEISATHCHSLVERVLQHRRPTRIFYLSDFDPGGASMPVAASRKIEFFARHARKILRHYEGVDIDIRLHPIALTLG